MWTPEVVQLKSGVTIVAELKFELPKSRFIFYAMVGDIYNFDSWKIDTKNLVFTGNIIKWDNAKHFLSLTRKTPFLRFCFSDTVTLFQVLISPIESLDCLNHSLYSYLIVGHIYNFDSWRNRYKSLVLCGKNKIT